MISRSILQKAILLIAVALLGGCVFSATPPQVGEIQAQPGTTLIVGEKAFLTIPISGQELEFEWTALRGLLTNPTQPTTIYIAPNTPGFDTVTVKVKYDGGETMRSITLNVVVPTPSPTPTATVTLLPTDTSTATAAPLPIICNHPSVTKNVFPQLEGVNGQYPIYGPVNPPDSKFLCEAVYDLVHTPGKLAVHIKYQNVGTNFGWWGVATPNGYDASQYNRLCFWAYTQAPNQAFRFKMKDTTRTEKGIVTVIEKANEWQEVCADISDFAALGLQVDKMDHINLGFEQPTGSAEIWIADFEFVPFIPTYTFTPKITGISTPATRTPTVHTQVSNATNTPTFHTQRPSATHTTISYTQTPNITQTFQAVFDEVDRQFQETIKSNIVYNAPATMRLGDTTTIELLLNPSLSQPQLSTQIVERGEQRGDYITSTAQPGRLVLEQGGEVSIVASKIQITDRMKAELTSKDPDAFVINGLHDNEEQPIGSVETSVWRWNVTAKKRGTQTLELVMYRLIKKEDTDYWREVESYRADIVVNVPPEEIIRNQDWKWVLGILLTLVLIPAFWRWIDNRKKTPREQTNRRPQKKRYRS